MELIDEIVHLRLTLLKHRYRYYVLCAPTISDHIYDQLEAELRVLVERYPHAARLAKYDDICPTKLPGSDMEDSYPEEARS